LATAAKDTGHSVISVEPPDSKTIAEFGWKKLQAGETTTPERLEANYMRRSDAEIFVKKTP
jgi:tRNA A37 threonylcarbamoyladenosine modification protein TsaB